MRKWVVAAYYEQREGDMRISAYKRLKLMAAQTIRLALPALILAFSCSFFFVSSVNAQVIDERSDHSSVADPGSILIQVDSGQDASSIESSFLHQGLSLQRNWPEFGLAQVRIIDDGSELNAADVDRVARTMQSLSTVPGVRQVGPDLRIFAADRPAAPVERTSTAVAHGSSNGLPSDLLHVEQWAHAKMRVTASRQIGQGSPALAVAMIDSGYDVSHEDLSPESLWVNSAERDGLSGVDDDNNGFIDDLHGWDWIDNDETANDPYGHGSHVGGSIAATTNNGIGIAGLGPELKILPLRVLDEQGSGQISDLIDAIYYAHLKGIRVANMSLVLRFDSDMLKVAIGKAHLGGMVMVAASGNSGSDVYWPARYPQTIAVGATDSDDLKGVFSNYGPELDVAAPGVDILSTFQGNSYARLNGTSMATAQVSALAGLVLSLRPDLSVEQVADLVRDSAIDVNESWYPGVDEHLGYGRIDFLGTLTEASRQLSIRSTSDAKSIVLFGDPAFVTVRVEGTSTATPASGAVIHYQLVNLLTASTDAVDHQGQILSGESTTDLNGLATLEFSDLTPGEYSLHLRVGVAATELQLTVQSAAAAIQLTIPSDAAPVGALRLPLIVELHDDDGQLISETMPLHLGADLGYFPNGRQEYDMSVIGGKAEIPFDAGPTAGLATISAHVGQLSVTEELRLIPGPPAIIEIPGLIKPISNWADVDETLIRLGVIDKFGNAVSDDTEVRVFADRGSLTESVLMSRDGIVSTILVVPPGIDGVAHIWAIASGTDVRAQVDVPVMGHAVWLPLVFAD